MTEEDRRLALVATLTAAIGREIAERDPAAAIAWPELPDVAAMTRHLTSVHRWVTRIVVTGSPATEEDVAEPAGSALLASYTAGREALLAALTEVPPERSCWIIGGRQGTVAFWRRRMVFENVKHLTDLRAAGGGSWRVPAELAPEDAADGIDELFEAFLWRSRPRLAPLPGAVLLEAVDTGDRWRVSSDWQVTGVADGAEIARIAGAAGDLAMAVWQRADPLGAPDRFRIDGDRAAAAAFLAAPIHPW